MAGNNYNLKGGYVQQGKIYTGQIKGDIAFVYSRLKREDKVFGGTTGYTTQSRSWRRVVVEKPSPQEFPGGGGQGYCCIECPDNCGDYTTKERCLAGSTDKEVDSGSDSSLGAQSMTVFLMYLLGKPGSGPYTETDLAVSSTTSGDEIAVWTRGFIGGELRPFISPAASMSANDALIVPPGTGRGFPGAIGWYGGLPSWKGAVWAYHRDYVAYYADYSTTEYGESYHDGASGYFNGVGGTPSPGYKDNWTITQYNQDHQADFLTFGRDVFTTIGESTWCSTGDLKTITGYAHDQIIKNPFSDDPTHTYRGRRYNGYGIPAQEYNGHITSIDQTVRGPRTANDKFNEFTSCDSLCVVWRGDILVAGGVANLMNNIKTYWGFETSLLCGGHSSVQGCFSGSSIGGNIGNLERPTPPVITWGEVKGRKSEVFLNFQDLMGNVKELKLPVEFSSRPTHIRFDNSEFYPDGVSGWLPRQPWYAVEWFDSRISMTKDDIFVDILYEMVQEWEPVNGAIRLLATSEPTEKDTTPIPPVIASYYNICGNYHWHQFLDSDNDRFKGFSRPKKTRFNKIKSFKINKISFAITATANYTYPTPPALSQETLHNNLIKHYTLLDTRTYLGYWDYYEKVFEDGLSSETYLEYGEIKIPYLPDSVEYLGLPLTYPQLMERAEQFARANDFIKPQSSWTQLDWIFWELLERPNKTDGISYIEFLKNGKFGYHGRTQQVTARHQSSLIKVDSPYAFYVRQPGSGIGRSLNIPDYYLRVLESERLRSGAKLDKTGKIVKWWRVSPVSFPVIMTGGEKAIAIN